MAVAVARIPGRVHDTAEKDNELSELAARIGVSLRAGSLVQSGSVMDQLADLQRRYDRLKLLYDVSNTLHSSLDAQEALQLIVGEAVRLTRATSGSVALLSPTSHALTIEAAYGLPDKAVDFAMPVSEGLTGWVARHGQAVRVADVRQDKRYVAVRPEVRSELAVPARSRRREIRGVINVDSDVGRAPSAPTMSFLLLELALQAAQGHSATPGSTSSIRFKAQMFESLVNVGQTINSTLSLDEALSAITREACALMSSKMSSLLLLDDDTAHWLDSARQSSAPGRAYHRRSRG